MKIAVILLLVCLACNAADEASWYGDDHRGLPMANGKPFNPDRLTAASWFYALGTRVVVTHAGRSVVVEITDRGPARHLVRHGRKIDLTRAAFARLANPEQGLIDVNIRKR
jgi:rare lipoprotein A